MISNRDTPEVVIRIASLPEHPASQALLSALDAHPDAFAVLPEIDPFAVLAETPIEGRTNRAVLRLFVIPDGPLQGRHAVFYFKRSQIPFSRDRFSYGVSLCGETPDADNWQGRLDFVASGFHPDRRPSGLRRAFTFTVPD